MHCTHSCWPFSAVLSCWCLELAIWMHRLEAISRCTWPKRAKLGARVANDSGWRPGHSFWTRGRRGPDQGGPDQAGRDEHAIGRSLFASLPEHCPSVAVAAGALPWDVGTPEVVAVLLSGASCSAVSKAQGSQCIELITSHDISPVHGVRESSHSTEYSPVGCRHHLELVFMFAFVRPRFRV
jgi:hypothetical protein